MGRDRHGDGARARADPARRAVGRDERRGDRPHRRADPRDQPPSRLVVVEHDMQFIRQIATRVTVFHQGALLIEDDVAEIMTDDRCATSISASTGGVMIRSFSPAGERRAVAPSCACRTQRPNLRVARSPAKGSSMLTSASSPPATADPDPERRSFAVADGEFVGHPRPQRHGQDDAAEDADRHLPAPRPAGHLRRCRHRARAVASAGAARHRLRAAGPRHLPGALGARQSADGRIARPAGAPT